MHDVEISIHDYGFVRLDDCMADDISVVNSARVSFGRKVEELSDSDIGLIGFLMRERHGTPFEHNSFRFHVRCQFLLRESGFVLALAHSMSSAAGIRKCQMLLTFRAVTTTGRRLESPVHTLLSR